ncbi:hypothetical protein [Corynebacterium nuruki]|uniref:hypothetical protein n=1 Tax=Corynebacterium nuruki TaxID=1032851 RepID=UPI0002485E45|nr:hypothetical protein [Corynebacterium nuruki]
MSDVTDYQRSKTNHPTGRHRRVSGCMGERSADPRHTPYRDGCIGHLDPQRDAAPGSFPFEAVLLIVGALAVVALVIALIISQAAHLGLGLTGVAVVAVIAFAIHTVKEHNA